MYSENEMLEKIYGSGTEISSKLLEELLELRSIPENVDKQEIRAIRVYKKREWKYVVYGLLELGFTWNNPNSEAGEGYNKSKMFNKNRSNYIAYDLKIKKLCTQLENQQYLSQKYTR